MGGHLTMSRWFATEWARGITDQVPPDIDTTAGVPLLADVGDVLFMHHLVPHAVGLNHITTPRLMAYFRVSHTQHATRRLDALRDPWLDYPALNSSPGRTPPCRSSRSPTPTPPQPPSKPDASSSSPPPAGT
ncbi:phytanoyl-CoA dioxygenase family protein [Streptomyces vinaceus]|uniref:hypothetical protein n=1 Tax=Streptomyces vinaceus TaxID=1960 RepID=UPI0036924D78